LLALPATPALRARVDALASGAATPARTLGVAIAPPRAARRLRRAVGLPERDGLLVQEVAEGSAAEAAGLARGDLIVAVGSNGAADLDALLAAVDTGADELALRVVRGVDERDVVVRWS
jgi:serine protease Do